MLLVYITTYKDLRQCANSNRELVYVRLRKDNCTVKKFGFNNIPSRFPKTKLIKLDVETFIDISRNDKFFTQPLNLYYYQFLVKDGVDIREIIN